MTTSARSSLPTSTAPPRSLAPDIARGLMLALIAIANVSWYLWGHPGAVGMSPHVPARSGLDTAVQTVMTIAVDHRAMPLFAFLFGYGMVQFHRSRLDRGMAPALVRAMLRRRHWAMLLLGALHAALLFYGDILGAYAIAGLLLVWIVFGRRTRTLIVWAAVIGGLLLVFSLFSVLSATVMALFAPPEVIVEMNAGAGAYSSEAYREAAYGGPYLATVLSRLSLWAVSTPAAALTAAPLPILLGWIAARHRLLDEPWQHVRTLRRLAVGGIAIGWLGGLPDALVLLGALPLPEGLAWAFYGLNALTGVCCGIGYAAAFALLAARLEGRRAPSADATPPADGTSPADATPATRAPSGIVRVLSAVGQRSLTFYLFQSLLLAPLMAAWGLGLAPHLSTWSAVAIALGVWLLSLPLAAWMDARGMRGPAEKLLRRMTYGKLVPAR